MSLYRELAYDAHEIDTVVGVQFCILSPDDIRSRSALEVAPQTYSYNAPVHGGLFDQRMGVVENNTICQTCEQGNNFCPGHFGHIELARPVFHVHFFEMVNKLLHCICVKCSRVPILPDNPVLRALATKRLSRQKRWEVMQKLCYKVKECPFCNARQPDKVSRTSLRIDMEWRTGNNNDDSLGNSNKISLVADDALRMFRRMTDDDIGLLGFDKTFNRPEWMICTVLLVPPPAVRPTVKNDVGQRQEDDLTTKLINIIKLNDLVRSRMEQGLHAEANGYYNPLQYEVATLIDNSSQGISPSKILRTGRPMRALTERLKSKEGRIRGNLMGKRVDFSARSVITPDPNISIDELGVPLKIAMNLTFPEVVSRWTRDRLVKLVENGPTVYPGAKLVHKVQESNRILWLKGVPDLAAVARGLVDGDVVDRHLADGDVVLFNRQPSLHKMSMMGHRVRVMPYNTFRLNVCVTPSFNADFDGDEMNLHVPQSLQTHEELRQLAAVTHQIISPRECKPIVSIVQDIATGVYRMTNPDVSVSRRQLMNLVAPNPRLVEVPRDLKRLSGHDLLSTVIPRGIWTQSGGVSVMDGHIQPGSTPVTKEVYQQRSNGLVHAIHNDLGKQATADFFDATQKLVCDFLTLDGFSVGISDLVVSGATLKSFKDVVAKMRGRVGDIIKSVHDGSFVNESNKHKSEFFERTVNEILNETVTGIGKLAMSDVGHQDNRLLSMINSGSKGNKINVAQMVGCVGQQNVDAKRIPYSFDSRTLPHYARFDDGPESRGFVKNSFIGGLTPQEFFFHSMGGREGLIDTAVKTSETGYIQRKLVKAMEDYKVNHDGTVRNSSGAIVQFLYGEDGMDPIKIEKHELPYLEMTPMQVVKKYSFPPFPGADLHVAQLLEDRDFVIGKMFGRGLNDDDFNIEFPVHVERIVKKLSTSHATEDLASPEAILHEIDEMCKMRVNVNNAPPKIFGIILRALLSPNVVSPISNSELGAVVAEIRRRFVDGIMDASEMVGVVAAQSISEPTTQLTLNTFHMSGVASASKGVRGVPRLKEIIDCTASKNMKTPIMTVRMLPGVREDKKAALSMMNRLRTTRFKDVITRSRIYFDPAETRVGPDVPKTKTVIEQDALFVELYSEFSEMQHLAKYSPWVLRLEFDRKKMHDLDLLMADVDHVLQEFYDDKISAVFSDDNAGEMAMRIRLLTSESVADPGGLLTELKALEHNIIHEVPIRGVFNIEKVSIRASLTRQMYDSVTQVFLPMEEFVIDTDGSNLPHVMGVEGVDPYRTTTNDIYETFRTLGVEAVRQHLYTEIVAVLTQNYINYRHVALLVDTITNKGTLVSVNRHGINQGDNGPLAKCSFEETVKSLVRAGIFSERDMVNGVSANIMLGQVAPCGTGDSKIVMDRDMLPDRIHEEGMEEEDGDEATGLDSMAFDVDF